MAPGECKEVDGIYVDKTFKPDKEDATCSDKKKPYVFKFADPGLFDIDCNGALSTNNPFTGVPAVLGGGWRSRDWAAAKDWPLP